MFILTALVILPACSTRAAQPAPIPATFAPTAATIPDWFNIKLTDVLTGQTFSINDFSGKVVLIETMAEWCPNCVRQQSEVKKLEELTNHTQDLVHISLDTDLHEDAATLKDYANAYGFDWYFAISPLELDRALGNLYSAEFMNPPLTPMLFIDRHGSVYSLPFGPLKGAVALQLTLAPYLAP
jgi:thiol-disulfide isomerase/thioredoxin